MDVCILPTTTWRTSNLLRTRLWQVAGTQLVHKEYTSIQSTVHC